MFHWLACVGILTMFVGFFYVFESKEMKQMNRNHPDKVLFFKIFEGRRRLTKRRQTQIKFRFRVIGMVGVVSIAIVSFIVGVKDTPRLLGFPSLGVLPWFASGSTSLLLTIALFLGPTYERALKLSKMGSVIHRGSSFNLLEFVKDFVLYQTPRTPFVPARNLIVAPFI